MGERRGVASVVGWVAFYAGCAARYALAAVVLFLAVHLTYVLLQGLRAPAGGEAAIRLDPVAEVVREETVAVSGRYQPFSLIQVQVNERLDTVTGTSGDGTFRVQVQLPRQVNVLRLVPVREGRLLKGQAAQATIHSIGDQLLEPRVQCVLEIPTGWLLMGFADARASVEVLDRQRKSVVSAFSDNSGIFNLPVADEVYRRPAEYTLRATTHLAGRAEVGLGLASALTGAAVESIARSVLVDLTPAGRKIELTVEASARLPQVARLLAGNLNEGSFLSAVFGSLTLPPGERGEREVSVQSDGRVSIRWVARLAERAAAGGSLGLLGGPVFYGPGDYPLLTPRDSFSVAWDNPAPTWFSPLPAWVQGKRATWVGPQNDVRLGFSPELAAAQPEPKPEERKQSLSVREILANVRFPVATAVAAQAVLSLIPFAWMLWLIRKHPWVLGSAERSRLATVCLVLGVMSVWYGVHELFNVPAFRGSKLWRYTGQVPNDLPLWACWLAVLATLPLAARLGDRQRDRWVEQVRFEGGRIPFLRPWRWVMAAALGGAAIYLARSAGDWQGWLKSLDLDDRTLSTVKSYWQYFPPGTAPAALAAFLGVLVFGGPSLALSLVCLAAVALAVGLAPALGWSGPALKARLPAAGLCLFLLLQWIAPARALWPRMALGGRPWRRFLLVLSGLLVCFVFAAPKWGLW
ncbi:MAG: hypothetical protein HY822_16615, partial [Acidobacteria bacterium]|nr:hypothetical protein [Acidobacteriota bacterium]